MSARRLLSSAALVLALLRHPIFREICARQYGPHASVSIFRAMMMNKPAGQGTGLGLSICREIVEQHKGRIEVHSRPGEGARFVVRLPAVQAESPAP